MNSAESHCRENNGPLKLAALCGRIARVVQRPAMVSSSLIKEPSHHDVFTIFCETSENVHGLFSIVGHALGAVVGERSKTFEQRKFLSMHKIFFSVQRLPTFENVVKRLQNAMFTV